MHPTLWVPFLGPVAAAPAMVIVGAATGLVVGVRVGSWMEGIDPRALWLPALAGLLGALAGGRLHFVLNNPQFFAHDWWSVLRPAGAMHIPGAVVGGLIGVAATVPLTTVPFARQLDAFVPAITIGFVLARVGCFLQGCCFGTVCHHPWCMSFPPPSIVYRVHAAEGWIPPGAPGSLPVHPTQLYFLAIVVLAGVAAQIVRRRTGIEGHAAWTGLVVLGIGSAAVEPLRAGQAAPLVFWLGRSQLWWSALALAGLGTAGFVVSSLRRRNVSPRPT